VTRVLVADDQTAVRAGFAALIAAEDDLEIAGEASNGREAVDIARRVLPHVVLMDIRMPVLDGLEATRLICADATLSDTRVLVLTTFDLSTNTSTRRCAPGPADSSSKTLAPTNSYRQSGSLPQEKLSSRPRSPDG
jgi:DNA-binding NarL/FixJ family response regulator